MPLFIYNKKRKKKEILINNNHYVSQLLLRGLFLKHEDNKLCSVHNNIMNKKCLGTTYKLNEFYWCEVTS